MYYFCINKQNEFRNFNSTLNELIKPILSINTSKIKFNKHIKIKQNHKNKKDDLINNKLPIISTLLYQIDR